MSNNIYHDFFQTLKKYLEILEIDKKHNGIYPCTNEEVKYLKLKYKNIPLAYEEYLMSIGKQFLFEFMNAENMSYDGLEYADEFSKEVFEDNNVNINRQILVISERRNDYVSFIYLDENDNPPIWIISHYVNEEDREKNLAKRKNKFTDLFLSFFNDTLNDFPATFSFVTENEINENENIVRDRYMNWFRNLLEVKKTIDNATENNLLVNELNNVFLNYFIPGEETIKNELAEDEKRNLLKYQANKKPITLLEKFKKLFK